MGTLQGEKILQSKTYAEMAVLIAAAELNPFLWYKISDRGDLGLVFRAVSPSRLETRGIRYMLCPATYKSTHRDEQENEVPGFTDEWENDWIGVWNAAKQLTATEGQLTIWNGLVWVAGETLSGDAPDTEASGWTVIPKNAFTNHEYAEIIFEVDYDFENDWINQQQDSKNNVFGLCKQSNIDYNEDEINRIDYCDWNYATNGFLFELNNAMFCFNNSVDQGIYRNNVPLDISGNVCSGNIFDNTNIGRIMNNNCQSITRNKNNGDILLNQCEDISYNFNNGDITTCISPYSIWKNINNGNITGIYNADLTDTIIDKTGTAV